MENSWKPLLPCSTKGDVFSGETALVGCQESCLAFTIRFPGSEGILPSTASSRSIRKEGEDALPPGGIFIVEKHC